jgi:putative hydrolase of the HAD superfamily
MLSWAETSRAGSTSVDAPAVNGRSVSAVFFDLYGTLIDIRTDEEDPGVYATLSQYLAYLHVNISPAELEQQYRSRVRACRAQSMERYPEVDVHQIFSDLWSTYAPPEAPDLKLLADGRPMDPDSGALAMAVLFRTLTRRSFGVFPDVHDVLEKLRAKYQLGLISDAQWVFTDPELDMADLARFFPVRILSSRVGVKKPDPKIFAEALAALGVTAEDAVYVGDNPERDLVGARAAGMRCILYGPAGVDYNGLRPDACFERYSDLEPLLDGMSR